jgi:hypothetical protein
VKAAPFINEPSRTRTCDPLVKSQLLYQLSYRPKLEGDYSREKIFVQSRAVKAIIRAFPFPHYSHAATEKKKKS